MKTRVVPADELDTKKGLSAHQYVEISLPGNEVSSFMLKGSRCVVSWDDKSEQWEIYKPFKSQGGAQFHHYKTLAEAYKKARELKAKGY